MQHSSFEVQHCVRHTEGGRGEGKEVVVREGGLTGDRLFVISATCPLLSIMRKALCSENCLAQSQPVSCTSCDLVCVSSDGKKSISLRLSLSSS